MNIKIELLKMQKTLNQAIDYTNNHEKLFKTRDSYQEFVSASKKLLEGVVNKNSELLKWIESPINDLTNIANIQDADALSRNFKKIEEGLEKNFHSIWMGHKGFDEKLFKKMRRFEIEFRGVIHQTLERSLELNKQALNKKITLERKILEYGLKIKEYENRKNYGAFFIASGVVIILFTAMWVGADNIYGQIREIMQKAIDNFKNRVSKTDTIIKIVVTNILTIIKDIVVLMYQILGEVSGVVPILIGLISIITGFVFYSTANNPDDAKSSRVV